MQSCRSNLKIPLSVLAVCLFQLFAVSADCNTDQLALSAPATATIKSALIRLEREDGRFAGTGVCISKDGTIAFRSTTDLRVPHFTTGNQLFVRFLDGGKAKAEVTEWSNAWQVGFAKVKDRRCSVAELAKDSTLKTGQLCFSAEYNNENYEVSIAQGEVKRVETTWAAVSVAGDGFPPIFDARGRLVGITTFKMLDRDPIATPSTIISFLLNSQSSDGNFDKLQLLPQWKYHGSGLPGKTSPQNIVEQTSVQICPDTHQDGNYGISGTFIGDNIVVTCGHHLYEDAIRVTVRFPSGDVLPGRILGSNPITDVGFVTVVGDTKEMPVAEIGNSSQLHPGDTCYVGGYPSDAHKLVMFDTKVVEPEGSVWGNVFYTSAQGHQVYGGMSGGGIFDQSGRIVGIQNGKNERQPNRYIRIEFAMNQWDLLSQPSELPNSAFISK